MFCHCPICKNKYGGKECKKEIIINKKKYKRIKAEQTCDSCDSQKGHVHHYGCEKEICPVCNAKLAFCDCNQEGII